MECFHYQTSLLFQYFTSEFFLIVFIMPRQAIFQSSINLAFLMFLFIKKEHQLKANQLLFIKCFLKFHLQQSMYSSIKLQAFIMMLGYNQAQTIYCFIKLSNLNINFIGLFQYILQKHLKIFLNVYCHLLTQNLFIAVFHYEQMLWRLIITSKFIIWLIHFHLISTVLIDIQIQ